MPSRRPGARIHEKALHPEEVRCAHTVTGQAHIATILLRNSAIWRSRTVVGDIGIQENNAMEETGRYAIRLDLRLHPIVPHIFDEPIQRSRAKLPVPCGGRYKNAQYEYEPTGNDYGPAKDAQSLWRSRYEI